MLRNIVERKPVEEVIMTIEFQDNDGCGCAFDCDENGNPVFKNEAARKNYEWAMSHPEEYPAVFNELTRRVNCYVEPGHGTCHCGARVDLVNQYMGACRCDRCGQWYNLFGQELLDPKFWEENTDDYYGYDY